MFDVGSLRSVLEARQQALVLELQQVWVVLWEGHTQGISVGEDNRSDVKYSPAE